MTPTYFGAPPVPDDHMLLVALYKFWQSPWLNFGRCDWPEVLKTDSDKQLCQNWTTEFQSQNLPSSHISHGYLRSYQEVTSHHVGLQKNWNLRFSSEPRGPEVTQQADQPTAGVNTYFLWGRQPCCLCYPAVSCLAERAPGGESHQIHTETRK